MTRMIIRAAVMWQISVVLHTKEGKPTDFVMGQRHSPVTFLSDCHWEQGLLVKGIGNIATCHPGLTLNLVSWEPD